MDLTRKEIFMVGGNLTDSPQAITYSNVVSRDLVKILLTIDALDDLCVHFLIFRMYNSMLRQMKRFTL